MSYTLQSAGDVINYANTLVQGNNNIGSTAGLQFFNDANEDMHKEMIRRGVKASQIQEAYRDATIAPSGQGSTFLYPNDMLLLKTMSINYVSPPSAGNWQNYVEVQQIDIGNTQQNQSFEFLRVNQPIDNPLFDDRGDWFEVFPSFTAQMNLAQAIRIFYYLTPTAYTTTGQALTYPETISPYSLAFKIVSLYYDSIMNIDQSAAFQKKYIDRLERDVNTMVKGADQPILAQGLGLTGWEF